MNLLSKAAIDVAAMLIYQLKNGDVLDGEGQYEWIYEKELLKTQVVDRLIQAELYPVLAWADEVMLSEEVAKGLASCNDRYVMIESFVTYIEDDMNEALKESMPAYVKAVLDGYAEDAAVATYREARHG